jgi:hypothetical protein
MDWKGWRRVKSLNIRTAGNESQISIDRLAQITVTDEGLTIDLANPSLMITQDGGRLTIGLHPRLAYVAPEERGSVAEDLGMVPYTYVRQESNV